MNNIMKKTYPIIIFLLSVILFLSISYADETVIRIIHVNDFHGFTEPHRPYGTSELYGGAAYLAKKINYLRSERPSLLLSAGDMLRGNYWSDFFKGKSVIEIMNAMGFDAMVPGNHEFDFGSAVLKERISEAIFPFVGANVEGVDGLRPYVIKEISGVKIAIIGIVTDETPITTHPDNVKGIRFHPPEDILKKYINKLRDGVDLIIVLSHIGYQADRLAAEKIKGIDVIVGGHTHTKLDKPVKVNNTIIVQAWEHGKVFGVLDLTIENKKVVAYNGHLETVSPLTTKPDRIIQDIISRDIRKIGSIMNKTICYTETDLDIENVRKKETAIGNLITDIIRQSYSADAAIIGGGSIRKGIKKGKIKIKDIYSAYPFNNYPVVLKLKGKTVIQTLEHGISAIDENSGRFPQVSGIIFKYSRSAKKGNRIKEVLINGVLVDPEKDYTIATDDFLAAGGDGYRMLPGASIISIHPDKQIKEMIIEYLSSKKVIAPVIEGRIKEVE